MRLTDAESAVDEFRQDAGLLGARLGPVLLQLPPNLAFSEKTVAAFLDHFRPAFVGRIVIEPRHPTWATAEASALLLRYRIDRVTADPAVISQGKTEKGEFAYFRLHGAPKIYYSSYSAEQLRTYRDTLSVASADSWCIFDNTASGAALANALEMLDLDYT